MWLLEEGVFHKMQKGFDSDFNITLEQQEAFEQSRIEASSGESRILSKAGENAQISIEGVLTNKPSFFARFFGGGNSTYSEIIAAFAQADADPNVKEIIMSIDSPGGEVAGMFDTLAAIEATKKPITAVVVNTAASAAYAIASKADKIIAKNRASSVGSIGVVATFYIYDEEITITSDKAPNKRPDLKTEEGKGVIKKDLNVLHDLFVESIANGRHTTVKTVNDEFGKGSMLFADDALFAGMIDEISGPQLSVVSGNNIKPAAISGGNKEKGAFMDCKQFKSEHPSVYTEAVEEGIAKGTAKEKDRVCAFLVAGEASGDMKTATEAIKAGSEMTLELQTSFMMAATNKTSVQDRETDDQDLETELETGTKDAESDSKKVLALVKESTGFVSEEVANA